MTSQEAFEAWWFNHTYVDMETTAKAAWQASREALLREIREGGVCVSDNSYRIPEK